MTRTTSWAEQNQQETVRALDRVRAYLERYVQPADPTMPDDFQAEADGSEEAAGSALASLRRIFGLSAFERDVLLLCAGLEMDARFGPLLASAQGATGTASPTFGLALAVLPAPHWSALSPNGQLRAWNFVELSGPSVTSAALRVDERVLHFLAGISDPDERLAGLVAPLSRGDLSDADCELALQLAARLDRQPTPLAVQVSGGDTARRAAVAAEVSRLLGLLALRVQLPDNSSSAADRYRTARLVAREALLLPAVPVVDAVAHDRAPDADARLTAFLESLAVPAIVMASQPLAVLAGRAPAYELAAPTRAERLHAWTRAFGDASGGQNGSFSAVCGTFDLRSDAIRAVAAQVQAATPDEEHGTVLWDACRAAARPRMDGLAERIDAIAGWDDLVLPAPQLRGLRQIAAHVRQRDRVFDEWGFARKSARGLGSSVLFAGASGTGKTMAAEVLARELRLDLYRIDLASVVNKYIGETEKNLKRLFDAAEGSSAILLFDEADALFGKRSEVKDSHDRYANIEVSYLLQRMDSYGGLAILTTNMRHAIDPAFLRRLRFIVQFPFPDAAQRADIWHRIFPADAPTRSLDYAQLAQLNLAGGHIRNVALAGAFIAADRGEPIGMSHLAEAARSEYLKLERTLSDTETRGWA